MADAVYLVSCVGQKLRNDAPAKDLYISDWFIKARTYVEQRATTWFILSAKHGLVSPDAVLSPYEITLNNMGKRDRQEWAKRVKAQMEHMLPPSERIVIFAGQRYREFLMDYLGSKGSRIEIPLEGLRIGEQLSWLGKHVVYSPRG